MGLLVQADDVLDDDEDDDYDVDSCNHGQSTFKAKMGSVMSVRRQARSRNWSRNRSRASSGKQDHRCSCSICTDVYCHEPRLS